MFINESLLNYQSAYSKSKSQKAKPNPHTWSYDILPEYFPTFPKNTIRILSLNCCRFPMTYYAKKVIASLILSAQPHIIFLQEVSSMSEIRSMLELMSEYDPVRQYDFRFTRATVRNLQLVMMYDRNTIVLNYFDLLFRKYMPPFPDFNRPVLHAYFTSDWFDINCYNLHLPSNRSANATSKRSECYTILQDHFSAIPSNILTILGGDWNTPDTSEEWGSKLPMFRSEYIDYKWTSDVLCNNLNSEYFIINTSPSQYLWDTLTFNIITSTHWKKYVSDHFPIILDLEII